MAEPGLNPSLLCAPARLAATHRSPCRILFYLYLLHLVTMARLFHGKRYKPNFLFTPDFYSIYILHVKNRLSAFCGARLKFKVWNFELTCVLSFSQAKGGRIMMPVGNSAQGSCYVVLWTVQLKYCYQGALLKLTNSDYYQLEQDSSDTFLPFNEDIERRALFKTMWQKGSLS